MKTCFSKYTWLGLVFTVFLSFGLSTSVASASTIHFTTDYDSGTNATHVEADTDLSNTSCNADFGLVAAVCMDPVFGTSPTYTWAVYDTSGGNAIIDTYYSDYISVLSDGEYYFIVNYNGSGHPDCTLLDRAACISGMGAYFKTTVKGCVSGGGTLLAEGSCSGGGGATTTSSDLTTSFTQIGWGTTLFWFSILFLIFALLLTRYWLFD